MELSPTYFMQQAYKLAEQAYDEDEVPIGAVVVAGNQIIGKGYNQVEKLNDPTAHAEMLAITAASAYLGSKFLQECQILWRMQRRNRPKTRIFWGMDTATGRLSAAAQNIYARRLFRAGLHHAIGHEMFGIMQILTIIK